MCLKVIQGLDVTPQAGVFVDLFLPFLANCPALQEAFLVQQSKDLSGHIGCVLLSNHKGEILRRSWPYRIGTPCPKGRQVSSIHSSFKLSQARTNNLQIMLNVQGFGTAMRTGPSEQFHSIDTPQPICMVCFKASSHYCVLRLIMVNPYP